MSRPVIVVASRELSHMGRIKCVCSNENILKERLTQLETWLLKRSYLQENVRPEKESKSGLKGKTTLKIRKNC